MTRPANVLRKVSPPDECAPQNRLSTNEPPTAERTLNDGSAVAKTSSSPQQSTTNRRCYLEAAWLRYWIYALRAAR